MKRPTPSPENVEQLIALCLELREARGPQAVDDVLVQHPDSADLVRERLDMLGRMGLVADAPEAALPEFIGPYRVLGELGKGGMGLVYEAEQERPQRRVALKILRHWPGEQGRSRFRHEAELLARLQHPGIAQVYEVGTATLGGMTVPFFAMELVRGLPVDRYADENELGHRARLELVGKIADAVHHAHQKGVVHRDLKPANVLVDERGEPRVLDFGIARVTDPDLRLETLRTESGQLVGTLAYMSPEQAEGDPNEIDSRSDVYSLGVMAYELLARRLPLEVEGSGVLEALRIVRDETPPLLGTLERTLGGDVETVVAKALAKEKERRYASAHELAADIGRYLSHEPVIARPATATYQLAKFARRHRGLVGGAMAALLALVLGLAGTLHGLARARSEGEDAERRFRQADSVLRFQKRMFATADPTGEGIRVADLLTRAAQTLEGSSGDAVEAAAVKLMLGEAFTGIGEWSAAEPLIADALETFERELGPDDLQSLSARTRLASLLGKKMGRLAEAEQTLEGVVERASREHGPDHDVALLARIALAEVWNESGKYVEAAGLARDVERLAGPTRALSVVGSYELSLALEKMGERASAIEVMRDVTASRLDMYGREDPRTWGAMERLSYLLLDGGSLDESHALTADVLALRRESLGAEHPDTLITAANLGADLLVRGDYEGAGELLGGLVEICERELAPDHPTTLQALNNLANVYVMQNDDARAEPLLRRVIELSERTKGPEHRDTLATMATLGNALQDLGQRLEAEELLTHAVETLRRTAGERSFETVRTVFQLGTLYTNGARFDQADPLLVDALAVGRETLEPSSHFIGAALHGLGRNQVYQGRYEEAEATLLEALEHVDEHLPAGHERTRRVLQTVIDLYVSWGRPEEAAFFTGLRDG
jgi:serine/threonine protein kinase/tetratricopeptide (TPR) repeat protein